MKNILVALVLLFSSSIFTYGQVSFYGVKLGDRKSSVESTLDSKGIRYSEETLKNGNEFIGISYPEIAGVEFNRGGLVFEDYTLIKGWFQCGPNAGTGDPSMPWHSQFINDAKRWAGYYDLLYQKLIKKYGRPSIDTDEYVEWNIGNAKISIKFTFEYENNNYGWIEHNSSLLLEYSLSKDKNDY